MKTERLIGIIKILRAEGKVTAPYLAEKLGVSRRTINRDIEDICRAGITVNATQGVGGGLALAKEYEKRSFSDDELRKMFDGIPASGGGEKLSPAEEAFKNLSVMKLDGDIVMDLSPAGRDSLSDKTELLRDALKNNLRVRFTYYGDDGERPETVEPALIIISRSVWYLYGLSVMRNSFYSFRLDRIWELSVTGEKFTPRSLPENPEISAAVPDEIIVTALYDRSEKGRLVGEYGPGCFVTVGDGKLFSKLGFPSYESAMRWFLSFGERVKIVAPEDFKKKFMVETGKILVRYK